MAKRRSLIRLFAKNGFLMHIDCFASGRMAALKKMMKYGFQYGVAPFLPYVGEKMYYRSLWSDTEYESPEYFTEEHRMREREINKEDHLQYQKSRDLLYWGKRFHFDFLWPRARYMDSINITADGPSFLGPPSHRIFILCIARAKILTS
nr:hypothetical protein [Bacillus subtilis]